jgi:hypothetical protein
MKQMKTTTNKITKLAGEYHKLISGDHHKDRDCHWTIETKWSYGKDPFYIVERNGYLHHTETARFDSYDSALAYLREEIKDALEIERFNKQELSGIRFPDDIPGEMRAFEL